MSDFSALCSRPGFMRPPGEIPMKVLMIKGFLATRSHASKPCLSIRELAGTRFTSMPVMPGGTGRRNRCQTFFRFTYFHGPSAARPLGWPLRMANGKVSSLLSPCVSALCGQLRTQSIAWTRTLRYPRQRTENLPGPSQIFTCLPLLVLVFSRSRELLTRSHQPSSCIGHLLMRVHVHGLASGSL